MLASELNFKLYTKIQKQPPPGSRGQPSPDGNDQSHTSIWGSFNISWFNITEGWNTV